MNQKYHLTAPFVYYLMRLLRFIVGYVTLPPVDVTDTFNSQVFYNEKETKSYAQTKRAFRSTNVSLRTARRETHIETNRREVGQCI